MENMNDENKRDPQGSLLRDLRKRGHFTIDNEMVDDGWVALLGDAAFKLYCVICRFANTTTSQSFPGNAILAEKTGLSKVSVIAAMKQLQALNMISLEKGDGRGHKNVIFLLDKQEWQRAEKSEKKARADKGKPNPNKSKTKGKVDIPIINSKEDLPFTEIKGKVERSERVKQKDIKGKVERSPYLYKETMKETKEEGNDDEERVQMETPAVEPEIVSSSSFPSPDDIFSLQEEFQTVSDMPITVNRIRQLLMTFPQQLQSIQDIRLLFQYVKGRRAREFFGYATITLKGGWQPTDSGGGGRPRSDWDTLGEAMAGLLEMEQQGKFSNGMMGALL